MIRLLVDVNVFIDVITKRMNWEGSLRVLNLVRQSPEIDQTGRYEIKSFATDDKRQSICAYGIFLGTHTGGGGPCLPTGKRVQIDYVYVMEFDGDKIRHVTKVWHSGLAVQQLGWV